MTPPEPGAILPADEPVVVNEDRETTTVSVENTGDRPVQVGSHFHFFEVNPALAFDRASAYGYRLDIAAGTAVRFEPGQKQSVDLVAIGGDRVVRGFAGLVNGPLDDDGVRERAMERAEERGYLAGADRDVSLDAGGSGSSGGSDGASGPSAGTSDRSDDGDDR